MYSLLLLAVGAFVLAYILTPICRDLSVRCGLVDNPDHQRKMHAVGMPRLGGVAIVISYVSVYTLLLVSPLRASRLIEENLVFIWRLLPAVSIVFVTGLVDDIVGLRPWQKILGQLIGSCWAFWAGVRILGLGGHVTSAWWAVPLTVFWLLICTNAFNLIDGVDGLAAGLGLLAALTMFLASLLQGRVQLALATLPLAGCLLGFLRYNFNPASIFLGDCGSLLIGFLLGCYGVIWSQKSTTLMAMSAPIVALAMPLFEVCLSIGRRFLRRQPIFAADRDHIHHRLLQKGLTPRRVVLLLYGVCGVAAALSLVQSLFQNQFSGLVVVLFCGMAWFGIQYLGYSEFGVAGRLLMGGALRRMLNAQLRLRSFEECLTRADSVEQVWMAVRHGYDYGFSEVRVSLAGRSYREKADDVPPENCWQLPVSGSEYVSSFGPGLAEPALARISESAVQVAPGIALFPLEDKGRVLPHVLKNQHAFIAFGKPEDAGYATYMISAADLTMVELPDGMVSLFEYRVFQFTDEKYPLVQDLRRKYNIPAGLNTYAVFPDAFDRSLMQQIRHAAAQYGHPAQVIAARFAFSADSPAGVVIRDVRVRPASE